MFALAHSFPSFRPFSTLIAAGGLLLPFCVSAQDLLRGKEPGDFLLATVGEPAAVGQNPAAAGQDGTAERVVVTGTGVPCPIEDTAVRTEILSSETITKTASRTFSDAMQYQTGVRVDVTCQNCNAGQIQMLGLGQRYVGILTNGHPVLSGLASIYGIDQLPTALIEIVKGGGSALYGPGAVAGAINIIYKELVVFGGTLELNYEHIVNQEKDHGVPPEGNFVLTYANPAQTFGGTVYGVRQFVSPTDPDNDGFTEVSKRDLWAGGTRLFYKPAKSMVLHLDYAASIEDRRGGSDDIAASPTVSAIAEEIYSIRNVATLTLDHFVSPLVDYSTSLTFSDSARDYYYGGTGAYGNRDPASRFFAPDAHPDLGYGDTDDKLYLYDLAVNVRPAEGHIITLGFSSAKSTSSTRRTRSCSTPAAPRAWTRKPCATLSRTSASSRSTTGRSRGSRTLFTACASTTTA